MDEVKLRELANYTMPFGKYAGRYLIDIPENYYIWFENKGFPEGKLGEMMKQAYEIRVNGLEYLLRPLQEKKGQH
ncbi:MAG: DUF3820 family protein [Spirochaetia bacterium]